MRHLLLAGTALLCLAAPAFADENGAKTSHPGKARVGRNHRHKPHHSATADKRDQEIAELKAEVDLLAHRLDAEEAAQKASAEKAEMAEQTAASAQTQSAAALGKVEVAQAAAAPASPVPVPPASAAQPGWWNNTTFGGRAFFNVSDIHQTSTDLLGKKSENAQNGTETELKRFYLSVDHRFNDTFSADLTTDFRYNANGTSKDTLVFVKKAYLQAKLSPAFFVRIGEAELPWAPFVESLYGYRFVENTLIDRTKFGTTTEWGVHVGGTLGDGLINYAASAVNGAGFRTLSRSSDTVDLEGRVSINPIKSITLGIGGYTGKLGKSAANLPASATPQRASRVDAVAAYTDKRVRLGVEYFRATNWNNVTSTLRDKADGYSAFGSFAFTPKVGVFGRYDWVKPSKYLDSHMDDNYFNLGVDFKPISPVDLALVYKHEKTTNGLLVTSNGTIGGPKSGSYDELGLFGQFVF